MQAWVEGVSTRKVDDLVAALGVESGISKSEVSRICAGLDAEVAAWRTRPLDEQAFPYVFPDATYCKARVNRRVAEPLSLSTRSTVTPRATNQATARRSTPIPVAAVSSSWISA
jgi:transposase-like protein